MHSRSLLLACMAGAVLAGCDGQGADASAAGPPAEHTIDPVTGARSMTIHREDGPATLRSGPDVPVSLPPGFSLFPQAQVTSNAIAARPGGQGVLVTFTAAAPPEAIVAHYRSEAQAAGFSIDIDLDSAEARTITGTRASDGGTLSLTVTKGLPATAQLSLATGEAAQAR